MNIEALNETADWLETSDFDGRPFSMGSYDDCVLGQCAARYLQEQGLPITVEEKYRIAPGLALETFGIRKSTHPDEWEFAFGAQFGSNPFAAAYRLRDLARNKVAPPRETWHLYHSVPQHISELQELEPQMAII